MYYLHNISFNDLILRLINQKQELTPFFGLFSKREGDLIEKAIDEARKENDLADQLRREE